MRSWLSGVMVDPWYMIVAMVWSVGFARRRVASQLQ